MGWIRSIVNRYMEKEVPNLINKEIERQLPGIIESSMMESFKRNPTRQVSEIGFKWALVLYFEQYWPDIKRNDAISCMRDCLEVPYGTAGYDWSPSAAEDLVRDYVEQYGE